MVTAATSTRVGDLIKKWKELGVDAETQAKIMRDLQMSVDERADKYITNLSAEDLEQQENISAVEAEVCM